MLACGVRARAHRARRLLGQDDGKQRRPEPVAQSGIGGLAGVVEGVVSGGDDDTPDAMNDYKKEKVPLCGRALALTWCSARAAELAGPRHRPGVPHRVAM
jgi:hypothetical protein